ncbi:MAG: HAMP domain-containing histidine kinase [Gammaproteobacteria bacterium]|nr:MAG: HAMP domain-containing histidine kinase [Gammaproteobacteria bacterium]
MNQSLLLLAKIENNQYEAENNINLTEVVKKYLHLFGEIIRDKQLSVESDLSLEFNVKLHPFLADSLVSNLIGNAVKYNVENGRIKIETSTDEICISNTSKVAAIGEKLLFQRFGTSNDNKESSTGLGLAIVKKIADANGLEIAYRFNEGLHQFCVRN